MSKKITVITVVTFVILAVAVGIIIFIEQKPSQNELSNTKPLTIEEAKAFEVDTSNWKTYESEDGILGFKYPQYRDQFFEYSPHDPKENIVIGAPPVFELGTTHAVSFYSHYLPEQGYDSDSMAIFLENYILVFDANISEEDLVELSFSENIAPPRLSELAILDKDLNLVSTKNVDLPLSGRTHSYFAYLVKLADGRHVYVDTRVTNRYNDQEYREVDIELAKKVVAEILESMKVN